MKTLYIYVFAITTVSMRRDECQSTQVLLQVVNSLAQARYLMSRCAEEAHGPGMNVLDGWLIFSWTIRMNKVFIQASSLAYEVYVEVSPLRSLPTTVCEVKVCLISVILCY